MAKGLLFLAVVVVLLLGFGFIAIGEQLPSSKEKPTMTYTPSTETSCIKDVCNKIIYSTTRFVYEDNRWKKLENAKSLKDKEGITVKIITDKDFPLEIIDFNYTRIIFDVSTTDKNLGKNIPLKVLDTTTAKAIDEKNITIKSSGSREVVSFNSLSNESILGKTFKYGTNSTTVIIQTAETENLEDTFVYELISKVDLEYGQLPSLGVEGDEDYHKEVYLKFNISSLPLTEINIDSATLNLNISGNELDTGEALSVGVHHVYQFPLFNISDMEWKEGNCGSTLGCTANESEITWNTKPATSSQMNPDSDSTAIISTGDTGWKSWNIAPMLQIASDSNNNNISIRLNASASSGSPSATDDVNFYSKENSLVSARPFLNITYTITVDHTPPAIAIIAPTNITYTATYQILLITANDNEAVDKCNYELNGNPNTTLENCQNTTLIVNVGFNTLRLNVNDTSGNNATKEVNFTVSPPMTQAISSKVASGTDYDFNESARIELFSYYINGTPITNGEATVLINYPNLSVFVNYEGLTELDNGRYYYNFYTPFVSGIYSYFINFSYAETKSYDSSTFIVRNKTTIIVSPSYNYSYNTTNNYSYNYSYTYNYTYNYTNIYNYTYDYFYNYTLNYTYENNNSFYYNYTFDYFYNYTYDTTLNNTYMYNYTYEYNNTINYTYEYAYTYNYTNDFNYTYNMNYTYDYNYTYINTTDSTYNYSYSYNYSYNYTNNYNDNYTYNDIFNLTYNYTYSYTYNYTNMTAGDLLCTEENSCTATGDMFMSAESIMCAGEDACNISLAANLTKDITTIKEFMYLLSSNDNMKLLSNHDSCLNSTHVIKKLTYSMDGEISEFNETMECPNGCSTSLNTCIPDAMTMNMWMIGIILILTFVVVAGAKLKEIVGLPLLGIGLVVNIYFLMMDFFSNYFKILLAVWVFVFIFTIYWSASLNSKMKKEEDDA